jgi:hypothetical protein
VTARHDDVVLTHGELACWHALERQLRRRRWLPSLESFLRAFAAASGVVVVLPEGR